MNSDGEAANVEGSGELSCSWERQAWRRLLAGMLVEQGLGSKPVSKRWQAMVKSGDFDPDRFADELLTVGAEHPDAVEAVVMKRSTRLQRDLLMAPLLRGGSGAARKMRGAARNGIAALVTQTMVVGIFGLIAFSLMLVLSFKGVEFDVFFQSILDMIPGLPKAGS